MIEWIKGNIVSITSALSVLGIYLFQKKDKKRKAAKMIIIEIRELDKEIDKIKNLIGGNSYINFLDVNLNSNSTWNISRDDFVDDLLLDDFNLFNKYFLLVYHIENSVNLINEQDKRGYLTRVENYQNIAKELALTEEKSKAKYNKRVKQVTEYYGESLANYSGIGPANELRRNVSNLENLTGTTGFAKIVKISKRKRYFIF